MSSLLAAQVVQLQRQVDNYQSVVSQHRRLLNDIVGTLAAARGETTTDAARAQISDAERRIASLTERQTKLLGHKFFDANGNWNPQEDAADRVNTMRSAEKDGANDQSEWNAAAKASKAAAAAGPSGGKVKVQPGRVNEVSEVCAKRIRTATARLLSLWFQHLSGKIVRLLDAPSEKFDVFHAEPTEDTLHEFMGSFEQCRDSILSIMKPSEDESTSGNELGPKGNPFELDNRLMELYEKTIADGFEELVEEVVPGGPLVAARPSLSSARVQASGPQVTPGPRRQQPPVQHSSPPQQNVASHNKPTTAPLSPSRHEDATSLRQHPSAVGERPPVAGRRQQAEPTHSSPQPARGMQRVTPLDIRSVESGASRASSASRLNTPGRHSRGIQDSTQMKDMLGGGPDLGGGGGLYGRAPGMRPTTPQTLGGALGEDPYAGGSNAPSDYGGDEPRLVTLRRTLNQLEMQLAGIASSGRDTGSEAKYYALTKKLQKVRAEVLREQREVDEVSRAHRDAASARAEKEAHRRQFHR